MTLGSRILLVVLSLALLLGVLTKVEGWRVDRDQQQQLEANVTDMRQLFRQFAVLPAILAADPSLRSALSAIDADEQASAVSLVNALLRKATDRSDAAFAFLMDTSGLTIAASNSDQQVSFVGRNYGFRPYFTRAMAGSSASYFAVGATTGVPGYFVSEPIKEGDNILGVVAVKLEPQGLPVSWKTENAVAVVTDALGVVILSTDDRLLYNSTKALDNNALNLIDQERRYSVVTRHYLDTQDDKHWRLKTEQGKSLSVYRVSTAPIAIEPWSLSLLTPVRVVQLNVLRNFLLLAGVLLLAGLLWHAYRQQVQLARERAKLADSLEQLVNEKTRELKDAQQALIAESNYSMLGKMSAAINHEINQPLASLRLNLATLRHLIESPDFRTVSRARSLKNDASSEQDEDSIQSTVIDLDRTAKRITRVIETLRALPQQNRSGFVPVDVHQLLLDSVNSLKADRKLLSKYLHLEITAAQTTVLHVLGQRILLQQALLNVLYNAMDAVAAVDAPFVELKVERHEQSIVIEVRDNGEGVSTSMESALFEPFESAPEKVSGLGIGLTLARQIINDHGGTLTYHRETTPSHQAPDGMTVFVTTLPLPEKTQQTELKS